MSFKASYHFVLKLLFSPHYRYLLNYLANDRVTTTIFKKEGTA